MKTQSGEHLIYHYLDAGSPEAHRSAVLDGGPWFYGPSIYLSEEEALSVYSEGYPTALDALAAAEAWEVEQENEAAVREAWERGDREAREAQLEAERQGIDPDYEAMRA